MRYQYKKLRQLANRNIIHEMEEGKFINLDDLEIVEKYYEEIFNLQLVGDISIFQAKFQLCHSCKKNIQKSDCSR